MMPDLPYERLDELGIDFSLGELGLETPMISSIVERSVPGGQRD